MMLILMTTTTTERKKTTTTTATDERKKETLLENRLRSFVHFFRGSRRVLVFALRSNDRIEDRDFSPLAGTDAKKSTTSIVVDLIDADSLLFFLSFLLNCSSKPNKTRSPFPFSPRNSKPNQPRQQLHPRLQPPPDQDGAFF